MGPLLKLRGRPIKDKIEEGVQKQVKKKSSLVTKNVRVVIELERPRGKLNVKS